jgi:DNA polymerase
VTRDRGKFFEDDQGRSVIAMYHPSAILRVPDKERRDRMRREFIDDLRTAREHLEAAHGLSHR